MNEKEYGTAYKDLTEEYFKLSDIINYEGVSYYVDTTYCSDVGRLETAVFNLKNPVPDDYNPFDDIDGFENNVDWANEVYVKTHKDKSEARRIHKQVCSHLEQTGKINNALN